LSGGYIDRQPNDIFTDRYAEQPVDGHL
jgi:hypothetical protein